MNEKNKEYIKKIKLLLIKDKISESEVSHLFSLIRKELELLNKYDLFLMSRRPLKKDIIEFECEDNRAGLKYRVIGLDNKEKTGLIEWTNLPNDFPRDKNEILAAKDKLLIPILEEISKVGYTLLNKENLNQYCDLKLFCDWILHNKIDKSFAGSRLCAEIHKTINKNIKSNTDDFICENSKTLLNPFKEQFHEFLKIRSLDTNIIEDHVRWKNFLINYFECMAKSPIYIARECHKDQTQCVPLKEGMWVEKITVIKSNLGIFDNEIYCLEVLTSDTTSILIPLTPEDS